MEITWQPSEDNPRALTIYIEQEPWKEVDKRLFSPFLPSLKKAHTLKEAKEIFSELEKTAARQEALKLLAVKSYFTNELQRKLSRRHLSQEAIASAIQRCQEMGALNDEELTALWVAQEKRKGRGPHHIALRLQAKSGKKYPQDLSSQEEQRMQIAHLLNTRYKKWQNSLQDRQRVFMALKRRGFDTECILHCFKTSALDNF